MTTTRNVGWSLFADVPHKPGWIAVNFTRESHLEFAVRVGTKLAVSFLETYEHVAPAYLSVRECGGRAVVLNPLRGGDGDHTSTVKTVVLAIGGSDGNSQVSVPDCPPNSTWHVSLSSPHGKFKLVRLLGC